MNMRTLLMGCTAAVLLASVPTATAGIADSIQLPAGDCEINAGTCSGGSCYINTGYCSGDCWLNAGDCYGNCSYNAGVCERGGSCTVNAGSCSLQESLLGLETTAGASQIPPILVLVLPSGDCEINLATCNGGSCYINAAGSCSGSCFVNAGYCSGSCAINTGSCYSTGSCYVNVGSCRAMLPDLLDANSASSSDVGCCPVPPLPDVYLPGGHAGDCQINAGTCDGGHCYFNAGDCSGNCTWNAGTCEDGGSCYVNAGSCSAQEALLGLLTGASSANAEIPPILVVTIPGGDCTINLGTCAGGQCFVNRGYCSGSCYINTSGCYGDCTINAGYCGSTGSCYVNAGSCYNSDTLLGLLTGARASGSGTPADPYVMVVSDALDQSTP